MQDRFYLQIPFIDTEHEQLFKMLESMQKYFEDPYDTKRWKFGFVEGFKFIKGFFPRHFSTEENYMKEQNHPDYTRHVNEHKRIWQMIEAEEQTVTINDYAIPSIKNAIAKVTSRVVNHILTYDLALVGKGTQSFKFQDTEITIGDIIEGLQTISTIMFGMDCSVKSENYALAEDLNDALFYRTIVRLEKEELTCFHVMDPDVVLHSLSATLGMEFGEFSDTLIAMLNNLIHDMISEVFSHNLGVAKAELQENIVGSLMFSRDAKRQINNSSWPIAIEFETDYGPFAVLMSEVGSIKNLK